jgi:DNA modification methylase
MQRNIQQLERISIDRLVPYARNSRTHSEAQVAQIAASIHEFGWTNPVLVDERGGIIAGHGRVLAAKELGQADVPCLRLTHLTETQKRAYVIADNKLALNADWDFGVLASELVDLDTGAFDMDLTGFSAQEIEQILTWAPDGLREGLTDPDAAPALPEVPQSRAGDVWACGGHRVLCGDATKAEDVETLLGGVKPHLMVTDPPYGVDYDPKWRTRAGVNLNPKKLGEVRNDDRADWREAWALFPGHVAYCWHAGKYASTVQGSLEASEFEIRSQIIWAKDRFALSRGDYHWQHEPCWYAVRKGGTGHWTGDRKQTTLWKIDAREDIGHGHSTQKPVECMRRPMQNNSSPGQAVYDPFLGSGTSLIAAEQTGRSCLGIEIHPGYVDVAVKRWCDFTGKDAVRESDGARFNDL